MFAPKPKVRNVKRTSLIFIPVFLGSLSASVAQPANREIVNQSVEWFGATANVKVSKRFSVQMDGQFRFARQWERSQHMVRAGLEYHINDHLSIVPFGYVYVWNYLYGKQPAAFENNEYRLWQQVFFKHSAGRIKVDHRLRLEQRFIQARSLSDEGDIIYHGYDTRQNRLRYRIMGRIALNNIAIEPKTFFISAYDEAFLSWGKPVTFHEPDQNRIYTGAGYEFNKMFTLQGGFVYQMMIKQNGSKQENNLGFLLQVNYNINLMKHS
jgi:hypothetical protein